MASTRFTDVKAGDVASTPTSFDTTGKKPLLEDGSAMPKGESGGTPLEGLKGGKPGASLQSDCRCVRGGGRPGES